MQLQDIYFFVSTPARYLIFLEHHDLTQLERLFFNQYGMHDINVINRTKCKITTLVMQSKTPFGQNVKSDLMVI